MKRALSVLLAAVLGLTDPLRNLSAESSPRAHRTSSGATRSTSTKRLTPPVVFLVGSLLPAELEAKLRRHFGKWRYRPASRAGEPVPTAFALIVE